VRIPAWKLGGLTLAFALTLMIVSSARSAQSDDQTVYVTKTGKKYHSSGCEYLRKSKISTPLEDALASGLTACSRCGGRSAAKGKIEKTAKSTVSRPSSRSSRSTSSRCAASTKKGSRCKRNAGSGSRFCWQHK